MATGFFAVFDNFQKEATGNRTDPETKQPQPLVRSLSVGFGPVLRFFSVLATEPSNTSVGISGSEMVRFLDLQGGRSFVSSLDFLSTVIRRVCV